MRQPTTAGRLYEKGPVALKKQIDDCYTHERGPGAEPSKKRKGFIEAIITPHSAYNLSGPCAAWAYKALAEAQIPDFYFLIGPSPNDESGYSIDTISMPFGEVRSDQAFARELEAKGNIKRNETLHTKTHVLEVQLPFLQHTFGNTPEKTKVFQLLIGSGINIKEAIIDIKETIADMNKNVTFIIASEFTRHGPQYKHVSFSVNIPQQVYNFDKQAITLVQNLDGIGFVKYCEEHLANFSGIKPLYMLTQLVKTKKSDLEQFYTSADIEGSWRNSVSYAAVIFQKI